MGPLEYVVIGFEGNHFTGEIMPEIERIRDENVVRILDLVFVSRNKEGHLTTMELSDLPDSDRQLLMAVDDSAGLWFSQDDIQAIGKELPADTSVAVLLLEHTWANKLAEVIQKAHGSLLGEGFVPRRVVDEVEALVNASA